MHITEGLHYIDFHMHVCYDDYTYHIMARPKENQDIRTGIVKEALPNTLFRISYEDGTEEITYLAGKMRMYRIRVLVGDKVQVERDSYGGKGRIIKRL